MEERKTIQRSRDRDILGDTNTSYFHAVANQRHRKKLIHVLDGPEGPITDIKDMLKVDTDYYKDLFSKEDRPNIRLRYDFFSEEEKVSDSENLVIGASFTLEEIKEVVFGSYSMELSYNKDLGGSLPSSIGSSCNLQNLILFGCSFTGDVPDS